MISVKNKSIEVIGIDKFGKEKQNIKIKNRLLDNYLNYILYRILPTAIGDVLFPEFASSTDDSLIPLWRAYIKYDSPQTITDGSISMSYDEVGGIGNLFAGTSPGGQFLLTENTDDIGKILTCRYGFSPSPSEGSIFYGIGFGRLDSATPSGYWLMAFLDLSVANIAFNSEYTYRIIRHDEFSTNEKLLSGEAMNFLPGYHYNGELSAVTVCYGVNGTIRGKKYDVSDLTFTYISPGNVSVTGFDDFYIENNQIYPSNSMYPSTSTYPKQDAKQIKSVIFEYLITFRFSQLYDPEYSMLETYLNINDMAEEYSGTDFSINLLCERGA